MLALLVSLGGMYSITTTLLDNIDARLVQTPGYLPLGLLRGVHLFVLLAGFALLFAGRGLYFGQRRSWQLVMLLLGSTTVLFVLAWSNPVRIFVQLALIGALGWRAGAFRAHSDRPTVAGALRALTLGLLAVLAYAVLGFTVHGAGFRPQPSLVQGVQELVVRALFRSTESFAATTVRAQWFLDSLSTLWIALLGAVAFLVVRAVRYRSPDALSTRERALALLRQHGRQSIAYMTTWAGNTYLVNRAGDAYIAYRVINDVALALGDPIGDLDGGKRALDEFLDLCQRNGWTPCLYATTGRYLAIYHTLGLDTLLIAEDTVIDLPNLEFKGRAWQDVRSALNKAEREGISFEWIDLANGPPEVIDQLAAISAQWVAEKELPEMGFTLGTLAEAHDPQVRTAVALDAQRTVQGFTTWLPVYEGGAITGWTIDLMRRRKEPQAIRGTMEFLIARAAQAFRQEGMKTISLSSAPLARVADADAEVHGLQRVLDLLSGWLEPIYGFRSLFDFKQKFAPRWEPVYLIYPGLVT